MLTANQSVGNYVMRVKGLADCDERFKNASQTALLRYEGAEQDDHFLPQAPELSGKVSRAITLESISTGISIVLFLIGLEGVPVPERVKTATRQMINY